MTNLQQKKPFIFFIFVFLIFPFVKPQMFDTITITRYLYYFLKIVGSVIIFFLFFTKFKLKQIHPFIYLVFLFRLVTLLPTLTSGNGNIVAYVGICIYDLAFVMLVQYGVLRDKKQFLKAFIFVLDFWVILNAITLFIPGLHQEGIEMSGKYYSSLLGYDNRYIYYFLPLIFARIIYSNTFNGKLQLSDYFMYFFCLFTLFYVNTTAALVVWLLFIPFFFILKSKRKFKLLNYTFILILFLVLNYLLIFQRIQNHFEYLIVDVLHKDLTLSQRTLIWDHAFLALRGNYLFGRGYEFESVVIENLNNANHTHNYMLMLIYRGGVVGFLIYCLMLYLPNKYLKQNKYSKNYKTITFIIAMALLLCLFDSFDYTIFYFVIFGSCYFNLNPYFIAEKRTISINHSVIQDYTKIDQVNLL